MAKNKVNCECYIFYKEEDTPTGKQRVYLGKSPVYKTAGAACADVAIPEEVVIPAHKSVKINLQIGFEIPAGYKIVMYPRSSLLIKRGLISPVSIIDSDFSGQKVHAPLFNLTDEDVILEAGERVAQIECVPKYDCPDWKHENNQRDPNGFGGTGVI